MKDAEKEQLEEKAGAGPEEIIVAQGRPVGVRERLATR